MLPLLVPDWPVPANVGAAVTLRSGGYSEPPFDSLNLGDHVGDGPATVNNNRTLLAQRLGLAPAAFGWLQQVHGTEIVKLPATAAPRADASYTDHAGTACSILTADCLPVLFCDVAGSRVAAAHAGWRGLAAGVLERALSVFPEPDQVLAWLGPAIGPAAFEVGPEVRVAFITKDAGAEDAFTLAPGKANHYLADLYKLARRRLHQAGVNSVYGGGQCTYFESDRFFSFRRDGQTGRMASLIWLK
jgi:hypothetical protein